MTPYGWKRKKVNEICDVVSVGIVVQPAQYYTEPPNGVKAFRSANIKPGKIKDSNWIYISTEGHEKNHKSRLYTGDVLVVRSGAPGTSCVVTEEYNNSNCIDIVFARPNQKLVKPEYLATFTNSDFGKREVARTEGGLALKHFNVSAYKAVEILLPPLNEQVEIIKLFTAWDTAIEKTELLIAAKEARFLWLIEFLIKDQCDGWPHLKAKKIFNSISEKNYPNEPLLSVTQDRGVIPRDMLEGRVMSPEGSTGTYKLIQQGDFVISLRSFQGGIEYSNYRGIISPAYTVLRRKIAIDDDFFRHFFKTGLFISKYLRIAVIGIRDGKQISIPDFMTIKIPCPPIEEQKRIASILNTARREIDLHKKQLAALQKQKRGLMQKLLTGKIRLKYED